MSYQNAVQPPVGLAPDENFDARFVNRSGGKVLAGELVMIDTRYSATETVDRQPGHKTSALGAIVDSDADPHAKYAIAMEDIEDNALGYCLCIGYTNLCTVKKDSVNIAVGNRLCVNLSGGDVHKLDGDGPISGKLVVGEVAEAVAATEGTPWIYFNGLEHEFGIGV